MFGLLRTTILSLALAFGAGAALAQDFQKGLAAAQSGDYATSLKEWRPLAEQGNERWSRNFGPVVKVDRVMKEVIQNDEEKEPRARVQGQGCA